MVLKKHIAQNILFRLQHSWQRAPDSAQTYGCIPHDLLIDKLEVYGLDKLAC